MENKETVLLQLQELRKNVAEKQKKGLHFIMASIPIWVAITCIHASSLPVLS